MDARKGRSEPESMEHVRERLCEVTLALAAVLGLPAVAASLARIPDIGWIPVMGLHVGAYLVVALMAFFRHRIPVALRGGAIIALIYIVGTGSFPSMAIAGSGVFFYLVCVVLSALIFGFRAGFGVFALCVLTMVAAFAGMRGGILQPSVDFGAYLTSTSSWVSKIAVFTLLSSLTLVLMTLMERWLNSAILQMKNEIMERKHAEIMLEDSLAEKETLLKEIHHRVKSNLQVITGLLELQLAKAGEGETVNILKSSRNRVLIMSLIHEELYRSDDLSKVRFDIFLNRLLSNLDALYSHDSEQIKIIEEFEPAYLPLDTAIPCALVINELVSNSMRHAFPVKRKGTIKVSFSSEGEDKYLLSVSDDGVGLPEDFEMNQGECLGMQIVSSIAEQLGADFWQAKSEGASFFMRFREYREAGTEMH